MSTYQIIIISIFVIFFIGFTLMFIFMGNCADTSEEEEDEYDD